MTPMRFARKRSSVCEGGSNRLRSWWSSQFASETAASATYMRPGDSGRGGGTARGGGGAGGGVPSAARALFWGAFFSSTQSARRGARTKSSSVLGKNQAEGAIIDLKSQSEAPAVDFVRCSAICVRCSSSLTRGRVIGRKKIKQNGKAVNTSAAAVTSQF
jgi:hypothetical protein